MEIHPSRNTYILLCICVPVCGAKLPHHKKNVLMETPQQCGSRPAKTGPVPVWVKTGSMESQPKPVVHSQSPPTSDLISSTHVLQFDLIIDLVIGRY